MISLQVYTLLQAMTWFKATTLPTNLMYNDIVSSQVYILLQAMTWLKATTLPTNLMYNDIVLEIDGHSLQGHDGEFYRVRRRVARHEVRVGVLELGHPVHHAAILPERVSSIAKYRHQLPTHFIVGNNACNSRSER